MTRPGLLVLLALVAGSGCQKSAKPQAVATIDGVPIERDVFIRYLVRKPSVIVATEDTRGTAEAKVAYPLGLQALRDLVNRRLLENLAKKGRIVPTNEDVDAEIEYRKKSDPMFVKRLTDQGLSMEDVREDVRIDLIQERLWTRGVDVSSIEVEDYIRSHPAEFSTPAEADLLWVVVADSKAAREVDEALRRGKPFTTVAAQYSLVPGARENGGEFPEKRLDRIPEKVRSLIERTPRGKSTDWFRDGSRHVRIHVLNKIPAKLLPVDAILKERVRRTLAIRRGQAKNDLGVELRNALQAAKVDVRDPALKKLWEEASRLLPNKAD